jgi:hypothetical protein
MVCVGCYRDGLEERLNFKFLVLGVLPSFICGSERRRSGSDGIVAIVDRQLICKSRRRSRADSETSNAEAVCSRNVTGLSFVRWFEKSRLPGQSLRQATEFEGKKNDCYFKFNAVDGYPESKRITDLSAIFLTLFHVLFPSIARTILNLISPHHSQNLLTIQRKKTCP